MRKRDILLVGMTVLLGLVVGLTSPTLGIQAEPSATSDGGNSIIGIIAPPAPSPHDDERAQAAGCSSPTLACH